jgi:hypothetical protein
MPSEFTKEELNALMSVQSKAVEQQVVIAERLKVIVDNQEKTLARLQNGLAKEISEKVNACTNDVKEDISEVRSDTSKIKSDTTWMKWLFGSVGLVVALSMVIINVYWLSHRASTASAVSIAVEEKIEEYIDSSQGR